MKQNIKHWERRALKAESELEMLHQLRSFDASQEMKLSRENAVLRVALKEIQDATNWAYGSIVDKLKDTK